MKKLVLALLLGTLPVAGQLEEFLEAPILKTASVGVLVMPLEGEGELISHQADLALIPASTLKAVTTATALQILGPDYSFKTRLYLKGDDLVILGGGDPTLSEEVFPHWWEGLKKKSQWEIKGAIIANPSRFESQRVPNSWPWGDVGNYYGAGASGLNFNNNTFELTFLPGKVGEAARVFISDPVPSEVEFRNHMLTGPAGSGDQGYVYGGPGAKVITLRGTIPAGGPFSIYGALPDPPHFCATSFRRFLQAKGAKIGGGVEVRKVDLTDARLIEDHQSPPLKSVIRTTNFRSVNLYADSLFKALTEEGTSKAAVASVKNHWRKQGVDLTGFVMHDGSGLSPRNVITARQLATIFQKARKHQSGEVFHRSLPVAGRSGSVSAFGKGTALEGRARIKEGFLTGVRTFTGYLTNKSGKEFVFAVMINNPLASPTELVEKFLTALVVKE